ncbi:LamG-like jellyroll fold domain-containing protein [Flavilitoribacter nigricans]|uniref:LamG-like jellyroll fold domain-containing protein n=1 Tax=Flavilitoribacter nigricans TaxID=70997 RepID=UPI0014749A91|nr:LamG-like jellyroll fold domain-containing protein [Flavilitoribacter nigricans]
MILYFVHSQNLDVGYTYDDLNRLIQTEYPNGTIIQYQYDKLGNRTEYKVTNPTPVDLYATQESVTPTALSPGNDFTYSGRINNSSSNVLAGGHQVHFHLNTGNTLDGNETYLGSRYVAGVPAGGYTPIAKQLSIPSDWSATGTVYLLIQIDALEAITETDEDNNLSILPMEINSCSTMAISFNLIVPDNCQRNVGQVTAGVSGGEPPFTYRWSTVPVQTTATATELAAGDYTVTVEDQRGCRRIDSFTLGDAGNLPASHFTYSISDLEVSFTDQSGGADQHFWDFGEGTVSSLENPTHQYLYGGEYEACLKVTNSCGEDTYCQTITLSNSSCEPPDGRNTSGIGATAALFRWYYQLNVDEWQIRYSKAGLDEWTEVTGLPHTQALIEGLEPDTEYEWQVRSKCANSGLSPWSSSIYFNTFPLTASSGDEFIIVAEDPSQAVSFRAVTYSAHDDTYVVTGLLGGNTFISKYDEGGNELWTVQLSASILPSEIISTIDKGYILAGGYNNDGYVVKLDENGQELWNTKLDGSGIERIESLAEDGVGNIILAGHSSTYGAGNRDAWLCKLSSGGTHQWSHFFGNDQWNIGMDVEVTNDGNYVLLFDHRVIVSIPTGSTSSDGFGLAKVNPSGTVLWIKAYRPGDALQDYIAEKMTEDASGNLYVAARNNFAKLTAGGDLIWAKQLSNAGNCEQVVIDQTGKIFLLGNEDIGSDGNEDLTITEINSSGTPIVSKYIYGGGDNTHFNSSVFADRLLLVGNTDAFNPLNNNDKGMLVIRKSDLLNDCQTTGMNASAVNYSLTSATAVLTSSVSPPTSTTTSTWSNTQFELIYPCGSPCGILAKIGSTDDIFCADPAISFLDLSAGADSISWAIDDLNNVVGNTHELIYPFNTSGTYTIYLMAYSNLGCADTTERVIEVLDNPFIQLDITDETCGQSDGTAIATITLGTQPYTYKWSTGGMNSSVSDLQAENYALTVTDALGCTTDKVFQINNIEDDCGNSCPDLAIRDFTITASGTIQAVVENRGDVTASITNSIVLQAYYSTDTIIGNGDEAGAGGWLMDAVISELAPGSAYGFTLSNINYADCQYEYVYVVVDRDHNLAECDETNNTALRSFTPVSHCTIPDCSGLINPQDGAVDVNYNTSLSWQAANNATGYRLTAGTSSGGTDILNDLDVGNTTNYNPGPLPQGATIYVTITPYNQSGAAEGCLEEQFHINISCRYQDSLSLVDLYWQAGGPNWTNSWDLTQPLDTWYGVQLNAEGCVSCLDLDGDPDCSATYGGGNNLAGTLPASMGSLAGLKRLFISFNPLLTGPVPPELGNLSQLEYFLLVDNDLTGGIPASLGQLGNLLTLQLQQNRLTGSIPVDLRTLSRLEQLYLFDNQLDGTIPFELGELTNLRILHLSKNKLTGVIPTSIGQLTDLELLYLSDNQLSGSIPTEIGNLLKLQKFDGYRNQLTGSLPESLGNLTQLTRIQLATNRLTGSIPSSIGNLDQLTYLDLSDNRLIGPIPSTFGNFPLMTHLYLFENQLTGAIPESLGELGNLESLLSYENYLEGPLPQSIGLLSKLRYLYLNDNLLSGCIPDSYQNLCSLPNLLVQLHNNSDLPGGGDFTDFCDNGNSGCQSGCTDPNAHNYDPTATQSDGSCATCFDGIQNGDETGIDCGGTLCIPCDACTEAQANQVTDACNNCEDLWTATPNILPADPEVCLGTFVTLTADDGPHRSLQFDGGRDHAHIDNAPGLQITGDLTIEMWLKPSAFDVRRNPLHKAYGGEYAITQWENGHINFYWGTTGKDRGTPREFYCTQPLTLNEWNHVAIVRDVSGNRLAWYLNGVLVTENTTTDVIPAVASVNDVLIGSGYQPDGYAGNIDEVRIWNTALDEAVIQAWKDQSVISTHPNYGNLSGYWSFDEGKGNAVVDRSPQGHNGQLVGSPISTEDEPAIENAALLWSTGERGNSIRVSPTVATTYTLENTEGNSDCIATVTVNVNQPQITAANSTAICEHDTKALTVEVAGGQAPYSLQWGDGQTGNSPTGLEAGLHSVQITDQVGCVSFDGVYIPQLKAGILDEDVAACSPEALSLEAILPGIDLDQLTNFYLKTKVGETKLSFTSGHNYTYVTEPNKEYLVLVAGQYTKWTGCDFLATGQQYFDPAFYYENGNASFSSPFRGAYNNLLPLNNQPNSLHTYAYQMTGDGSSIQLFFHDTKYEDNCGQFNVQIWELGIAEISWSNGDTGYRSQLDPANPQQEELISVFAQADGQICSTEVNIADRYQMLYADTDGDGYGDPAQSLLGCASAIAGYVTNDLDCDDTRNEVYPGAPELCDGIDNNCDEVIDQPFCGTICDDQTIDDDPIQSGTYVGGVITSGGWIAEGSNVIFQAENAIVLKAGFQAEAGSSFRALIAPCEPTSTARLPEEETGEAAQLISPPPAFRMSIYPNPAGEILHIRYELPLATTVQLVIWDTNGKEKVNQLLSNWADPGAYTEELELQDLAPGIYFISLLTDQGLHTERVMVAR